MEVEGQAVESQASQARTVTVQEVILSQQRAGVDQARAARDLVMEDTDTAVDQAQGSQVKDPVDMVMAVGQAQGSQEKHLDTVDMAQVLIRRVPKGGADLILSQARDHLVVTDMAQAVARVNLGSQAPMDMDQEVILSLLKVGVARVKVVRDTEVSLLFVMDLFLSCVHNLTHKHHLLFSNN